MQDTTRYYVQDNYRGMCRILTGVCPWYLQEYVVYTYSSMPMILTGVHAGYSQKHTHDTG